MSSTSISKQNYDYFMVLDFEATCDNETDIFPQVKLVIRSAKGGIKVLGSVNLFPGH